MVTVYCPVEDDRRPFTAATKEEAIEALTRHVELQHPDVYNLEGWWKDV